MPVGKVKDINIFYRVDGPIEKHPVLLISGLGSDHRRWQPFIESLKDAYRCISFDNRDVGQSERIEFEYSINDMARDVAGLLETLGITSAHVIGNSMGGAIAQELALTYPNMVEGLVLISTYTSGDHRGSEIFHNLGQLRRRLNRVEYQRHLLPWLYTFQEYQIPGFIDEAVRKLEDDPFYQDADAYERQIQATITFSSQGRLEDIKHRTLLIFGEDDIMTPLRFANELHQGISNSELVILNGTGHGLLNTRTAEVVTIVDGFLKNVDKS
jgi:3-oxoadipate enol-lactonase